MDLYFYRIFFYLVQLGHFCGYEFIYLFILLKKFFHVYLFLRERETDRVQVGKGKREREIQNLKQAPGSAQSPTWGSNSTNSEIMT